MNRQDRETLELLQKSFAQSAEKINVPESLSKENILLKLKAEDIAPVVPISSAKKRRAYPAKRIAAVAACFVLVMVIAAVARNMKGGSDLGIKSAFEGLKISELIKSVESREELDSAVRDIVESSSESKDGAPDETGGVSPKDSKPGEKPAVISQLPEVAPEEADPEKQADIVKYSRGCLFILTSALNEKTSLATQVIRVIKTSPEGEMSILSSIELGEMSDKGYADDCFELQICGNTLVAVIERRAYSNLDSSSGSNVSTVTMFYDIADPSEPKLIKTNEQEGKFVCCEQVGNEFCVVTTDALSGENPVAAFYSDGVKASPSESRGEITVAENARENGYLFITAAPLSGGESASMFEIIGCGPSAMVTVSDSGVYVARQLRAVGTSETRTEIYRVTLGGSASLAGTYGFDGSLCAGLNVDNDYGVYYVYSLDEGVYAGALTFGLKSETEDEPLGIASADSAVFIGSCAYVTGEGGSREVKFSGGEITVSESSLELGAGEIYPVSDSVVMEISGAKIIRRSLKDGSASAYSVPENMTPLLNDPRAVIADEENGLFGIPVIVSSDGGEKSAYLVISVADAETADAEIYVHNDNYIGDAATRAVISGSALYTVSGESITAFSIKDDTVLAKYEY